MKRLVIALSIVILLAIFSPLFPILAQPTHTPHENPAMAKGSLEPIALLFAYSNVFDLAANRQYQNAQNMLSQLEQANIPDELRYITDRYNTLCRQLFTTQNNIERLLYEASTLFSDNQFSDARQKLDDAEVATHDARLLQEDIETTASTLSDELGVFATSATTRVKDAHDRLEQSLYRVRQPIDELDQLRESLSRDPQMIITTSFRYATHLEVSAPETAYPGLPITVSGQVISAGDSADRTIKILLDNAQLAEGTTRGKFSFEVTPPEQSSTGKHSLTVAVTPQGHYSGTSRRLNIDISRIPIQTDIQVPQLLIIPRPIQISGKVSHNLAPVQDARVSLALRRSSTTAKTAADGSFTATVKLAQFSMPAPTSSNLFYATTTTVELPIDLSLIGTQELTITVEPIEPWYASLDIKRWVFMVNPANMGLMLVVFLSLGLLVYSRVRIRATVPLEEKVIPQPQVTELPAVTPALEPKYKLTGTKGRILSAYISGLKAVEKMAGIPMAPHTTLREFLKTAAPKLPTAIKPFSELTTIAEVALYSVHRLDEDIATRAEQLAAAIKKELYRGTA